MKEERKHQTEAKEVARETDLGIFNSPPGTGKTIMQGIIIEDDIKLGHVYVYVVLSPRILLADQLLNEFRELFEERNIDAQYLVVHSGNSNEKRDMDILRDMPHRDYISTTSPSEIRRQYKRACREKVPLIISSTYHSADKIVESGIPIHITHCDEAHYLVQPQFNWIATKEGFKTLKKYFFTATIKNTPSSMGLGMNNKSVYGGIVYQKLPLEMIYAGEILRPRMHIIDVPLNTNLTEENELNMDVNAITSAFIQHRSVCNVAPKMLVTTKGSEHQNNIVNHPQFQSFLETRPGLRVFDITSEFKPRIDNVVVKRNKFFKELRSMSDNDEAIILHICILTEGIDVPGITGVMLMNNPSLSDFIQNLGRATRLHVRDRMRIYSNLLKPDELTKFVKPYAYIIVPKYGPLGSDINDNIKMMVTTLRKYGFDPMENVIISDSLGHVEPVELGSILEHDARARSIMNEFVDMVNEIENEEEANRLDMEEFRLEQKVDGMSIEELISSFGTHMSDKEFNVKLEKLNDSSTDTHKIDTSLILCRDMFNSLFKNSSHTADKDYLCISNFEFLHILKEKLGTLDDVWFATPDVELKGRAACVMGIKPQHLLVCKYETATIETEMKFDIIISNPPYNPNSIWKKFVELQISMLKDDGKMVTIHPPAWRNSAENKKLFNILKKGIEELHICDFEAFKDEKVNTPADWYIYSKNYQGQQEVFYSNGDKEILNLKNVDKILRVALSSPIHSIVDKIFTKKDNGVILQNTGFGEMYKTEYHSKNGKYKQCGGSGNGTGWCEGKFVLTDIPSKHQFENKVVMAYCRQPRAHFFSKEEEVGVILASYWLTDNQSLPLLLNSKMFWKTIINLSAKEPWRKTQSMQQIPNWLIKSINFDGLKATTEEELYEHYKLTKEEINWIENG